MCFFSPYSHAKRQKVKIKIKKMTRINEVDVEGSLRHGHKITKMLNMIQMDGEDPAKLMLIRCSMV